MPSLFPLCLRAFPIMRFVTPIWLLALIPWTVLAVWMLWGRRASAAVPFLALWREGDVRPNSDRWVQPPPIAIALLLLAILLTILAAGSPALSTARGPRIAIVIDRGITMSARDGESGDGDSTRYAQALREVMKQVGDSSIARVVTVPGAGGAGAQVAASLETIAPTAIDTSADVEQAVLRLSGAGDDPVVVVTDAPLRGVAPRLIVVPPAPLIANVGIAHVAARETPSAQVMVRLGAQPPSKQTVVVTSDGERVERTFDAPGMAFIDMPRLGRTIEVALATGDALFADDRAWLVRESGWPRIEAMAMLAAELSRMVETYRKLRPPRDDARTVSIVDDLNHAAGEAVILAPAEATPEAPAAGGAGITVVDHPITAGVTWSEVVADARMGAPAPAGFGALVAGGERVAVAVREAPPRQVWVALDGAAFPRRADYVVFWTNVFDWLGQGGETFASHPVESLGVSWRRITDGPADAEAGLWPGLYERSDGTLRAVNAPAVTLPPPLTASDSRARLSRASSTGIGDRSLAPYLLLGALACALGAAVRWPARRAG